MKRDELGRSMIEMLGVLAIVGILSIGAISGFQKAMFKHRLQKTTEEYNMLFQDTLKYHKELLALRRGLKPGEGGHYRIAELLYNMGIVPAIWQRKGTVLYDRLNNQINPFIRKENNKLNFDIHITANDTSIFVCEAIYRDVFMQFSDNLYYVQTYRYDSDGAGKGAFQYFGNLYCNSTSRKCVRDMTLTDIRKMINRVRLS
ncbi:MAG: type II secretion system protein [Alphaproteobacteria bacterium]|nr:type II secretion system protein [Alphaproteobacteria bacterium]MBP3687278.1 type II secretion system protein [Alphaproteobacteria bacterium]